MKTVVPNEMFVPLNTIDQYERGNIPEIRDYIPAQYWHSLSDMEKVKFKRYIWYNKADHVDEVKKLIEKMIRLRAVFAERYKCNTYDVGLRLICWVEL